MRLTKVCQLKIEKLINLKINLKLFLILKYVFSPFYYPESNHRHEKKLSKKEEFTSSHSTELRQFLRNFQENDREDNFLSIRAGNYSITLEEASNEIVNWTLQYLQYM